MIESSTARVSPTSEGAHGGSHIQPHGVLLAFVLDRGLCAWSANASELLGMTPDAGSLPTDLRLPSTVTEVIRHVADETDRGSTVAQRASCEAEGSRWDVLAHASKNRVIVEFERAARSDDDVGRFAISAHRLIARLKSQRDVGSLLDVVVQELREATGYDRLLVYRFRPDDSGDVVAEARRADLEPLLGMRYPAADVSVQARRLHLLNTVRVIHDVDLPPVPMVSRAGDPLPDLSQAVLRSPSAQHADVLRAMGVRAAMSIAIVVADRLWGLVVCQHEGPHRPSQALRMACDVMAQVVAARVAQIGAIEAAATAAIASATRERLMATLSNQDDILRACAPELASIAADLRADALLVSHGGRVLVHGPIDVATAHAMHAAADAVAADPGTTSMLDAWPPREHETFDPWVGVISLNFDPGGRGRLTALRRSVSQTVRWAGPPMAIDIRADDRAPRSAPGATFGNADAWSEADLEYLRRMQAVLQEAVLARHAEVERARTQMLAMLGHDLRNPLQAISMAARALSADDASARQGSLGDRIKSSSSRMARLVDQVLDLSRIRSGQGLGHSPQPMNMAALLRDVLDESRTAHPGIDLVLEAPGVLEAEVDPDRIAQALSNLLGNARHHGDLSSPVRVTMGMEDDDRHLRVVVRNRAAPIPDELAARLFEAFKPMEDGLSAGPGRRRGLGLGLFIAAEIVRLHGGTLNYVYEAPEVTFVMRLPRRPPDTHGVVAGRTA